MVVATETTEEALVTWCVRVPENTPENEGLYICGNAPAVGSWNPRGIALRRVEPRLYRVELSLPVGTRLEYKFTRGSWQTVEKTLDGTDTPNRVLVAGWQEEVLAYVESWADRG